MTKSDRSLIISDLQIPFEARYALKFCKAVQRDFGIPPENVFCAGDEVDQYFGSRYQKDPDSIHTATSELKISLDKMRQWYAAFPKCRVAISNHGTRWAKRAFDAEIPSQMIKPYQELLQAPEGWKWAYSWRIAGRVPFRVIHGMGYSGMNGHRTAAIDAGISTAIGHLHAHAGVSHIMTDGLQIWGMNTGCLIDAEAFVFHYAKESRFKATLGVGVVLDGGLTPVFVPYERFL